MQWLTHFVNARHGQAGTASEAQTRGLVITSAWRYDLLLWLGNLITRGKWQALRQTTADLAQLHVGERVLEVGCGTGTLALIAKQRVGATGRVSGIDPSVQMIARARRKAARHSLTIDFEVGVIEQLAFPDQSFDVVLSSFMMHQLPDDLKRQGLAEIARVLRPGGRLVVIDTRRPEEQHGRSARPIHVGPWNSGIQDQPALMQAAGFSQIEHGVIDTGATRLPEIGFALGRISQTAEREPPMTM
ncbi:MAG TPA: methyltransferase domain-containing protein [Roseiflexaceae bacterium]|nr:methyltransferase domain-containing protein [Roseiflexaceae bacterium]